MRKKLLYVFTIIILCISSLMLFNNVSYASSQYLKELTYEVQLNEDGSADVVETWNIRVYNTNTLFKTFEIDNSKYSGITNVSVKDITDDEEKIDFVQTDSYAYHVEKGHFYALETSSTEFEIAWGVSLENTSATKTYQISYTITDAVTTYNDCSEFYWQFIGTTNAISVDEVKGTIKLPSSAQYRDNIKVWAHGPLDGEIYIQDTQTVTFEVKYLSTETMVEARVVTLDNMFLQSTNTVNENKLDSIVAEETKWADEANAEREKEQREEEMTEFIAKIIVGVIVLAIIGVMIFFVLKIIKYGKELFQTKRVEPEEYIKYFRDLPDNTATPGEAAYLYYFNNPKAFKQNLSKIISAIILSLNLKKAVEFKQDKKGKVNIILNEETNKGDLMQDERTIFELLQNIQIYIDKDKKEEENGISMDDIEKYAKKRDRDFLARVEGIERTAELGHRAKKNYDPVPSSTIIKLKNKARIYFVVAFIGLVLFSWFFPLFISILSLICGIECKMIAKKSRTLTRKRCK